MKRISVILTTCHSEATLNRTLDSIFGQQGIGADFELELLIIDDHSTDGTLDILRSRNLPWFSTPFRSGGPNRGRNIGLDEATGDYITFIDHDDVWHPLKLKYQLQAASFAPVVFSAHQELQDSDHLISDRPRLRMRFAEKNHSFLELLRQKPLYCGYLISGVLIHKDLRHLRFEEHLGFQDLDWKLRILYGNPAVIVPAPLVGSYYHPERLSLQKKFQTFAYSYATMTLESYRQFYPRAVQCGLTKLNFKYARSFYRKGQFSEAGKYFKRSWSSILGVLWFIPSLLLGSLNIKRIRVSG